MDFCNSQISKKKTAKNTFGWARAEVLGALVNAVFLLALCFSILVESIKRIAVPEGIEQPVLLVTVGTVGLLINLVGLAILGCGYMTKLIIQHYFTLEIVCVH